MEIFKCPVCNEKLEKKDKSYSCVKNHTYDISKQGYINLLLNNEKNSKNPGDNKEMILARQNFLNKNYYKNLSEKINETIKKYSDNILNFLDAGCGEGYYISELKNYLNNDNINFYGIDISKEATKLAGKKDKKLNIAVASVFHSPFIDESFDCILSVFAPFKEDEFYRLMKKDSILITVSPAAYHLFELKEKLYENPYLNPEDKIKMEKLENIENIDLKYKFFINNSEDINNLLKMTPYYWKTDLNKINEVFEKVESLNITAEFMIKVFKK